MLHRFSTTLLPVVILLLVSGGEPCAAETRSCVSATSLNPNESGTGSRVSRYGLTRRDYEAALKSIPGIEHAIPSREIKTEVRVADRGVSDVRLIGSTEQLLQLQGCQLAAGRNLIKADQLTKETVVVLGPELADRLFPQAEAIIGKSVKISNRYHEVVGVMSRDVPPTMKNCVLMPISTMRVRLGDLVFNVTSGSFGAEQFELTRFDLILKKQTRADAVRNTLSKLLAKSHGSRVDYQVAVANVNFTEPPKTKPITRQRKSVLEMGTIEPAGEFKVRSMVEGQSRITFIAADGQQVKKGDVVLKLENRGIEIKHVRIRSELESLVLKQNLAELTLKQRDNRRQEVDKLGKLGVEAVKSTREAYFGKVGEYNRRVAALKRAIQTAKKRVAVAEAKLARAQGPDGTPAEIEEQQLELQVSRDTIANNEAELLAFETVVAKQKEAEFALALAKATSDANALRVKANDEYSKSRTALAQCQADIAVARTTLSDLKKQVESLKVVAMKAGTALLMTPNSSRGAQVVMPKVGAVVRERQDLLRIIDMSQMRVRVRVHESRIARVKKGQQCRVKVDAYPGKTFTGTVQNIASKPVPGSWPNTDLKEFEVLVSLEAGTVSLKPGMTCEVRIFGE